MSLTTTWVKGSEVRDVATTLVALLAINMNEKEFEEMLLGWGESKREHDLSKVMPIALSDQQSTAEQHNHVEPLAFGTRTQSG
tara:strand:+ start:649 stop:897 length:249 start_codon:yes stop_codon:yes gene_type:complete